MNQTISSSLLILYYANCCVCFQIQLICSGDVEANPAPKQMQKCQECEKTIWKNKKVNCKSCFNLFHEKCLVLANDIKPTTNNFICTQCRWAELPFYTQYDTSSCDLEQPSCAQNALNRPSTESQVSNEHLSCLIAKHKTPEVHAS